MKKQLTTETLIEMLPLIGWKYFKSPSRLNDKLITNNGNIINIRVEKDRFDFVDIHTEESDYYNVSYRLSFNEHEIEHHEDQNFIAIIPKGQEDPATFMLMSGDKEYNQKSKQHIALGSLATRKNKISKT